MKRWVPYFIFSFALLISSADLFAQDAGMSDSEVVHERDFSEADKAVFIPGEMEVRYVPRATGVYAPNDSVAHTLDFARPYGAQKPADAANEKQPVRQKDDSILTFNFLYYIIQKYKLQDIID